MKKIILICMVATGSSALLVDDSDNFIRIEDRAEHRYFYKCHRPTATCQLLTGDGLRAEDFARLATVLEDKYARSLANQSLAEKLEKGAIATLTFSAILILHRLHRRGALRMMTKDCCGHNWWHKLRKHFPQIDLGAVKRFFFKDNSWLLPVFGLETLAVYTSMLAVDNSIDRQTIYQFLQTELTNLQEISANDEEVSVRSLPAIEFMIYEIVRRQRADNETQTVDH